MKSQKCNSEETSNSENIIHIQNSVSFQQFRQKLQWSIVGHTQRVFNNNYLIFQLLESEKFYDLYKVLNLKTKNKLTLKIIDKSALKNILNSNKSNKSNFQDELIFKQILTKINLENFVQSKLYDRIASLFMVSCEEIFENDDTIITITDNYHEQTLENIIKRRGSIPLNEAISILKQIILGLSELHKQGIVLTELNPNSIYHKNGIYKLTDFSSLRKVGEKFINFSLKSSKENKNVEAPELQICPDIIDLKSQIWALGILFYRMIAHETVYQERGSDIIEQAKQQKILFSMKHGRASEDVINFFNQVMIIDPNERISWKKLMNHQIFENTEYFYSLKDYPIVDARGASLKKHENFILPEEIQIQKEFEPLWYEKLRQRTQNCEIDKIFTPYIGQTQIYPQKFISRQDELYKRVKVINLKIQKAHYFCNQVLMKVFKSKVLDEKRRSHLELIFLILTRCNNYSYEARRLASKSEDRRLQNYAQQLKYVLSSIRQTYDKYRAKLNKIHRSTYYISNDLFSTLMKKNFSKQKQRFLYGHQGADYQSQQQINFTYQNYISKIKGELKGDSIIVEIIWRNLKGYISLNDIKQYTIQGKHTFQDVVDHVLWSQ